MYLKYTYSSLLLLYLCLTSIHQGLLFNFYFCFENYFKVNLKELNCLNGVKITVVELKKKKLKDSLKLPVSQNSSRVKQECIRLSCVLL